MPDKSSYRNVRIAAPLSAAADGGGGLISHKLRNAAAPSQAIELTPIEFQIGLHKGSA